jgi:hypothetical protein
LRTCRTDCPIRPIRSGGSCGSLCTHSPCITRQARWTLRSRRPRGAIGPIDSSISLNALWPHGPRISGWPDRPGWPRRSHGPIHSIISYVACWSLRPCAAGISGGAIQSAGSGGALNTVKSCGAIDAIYSVIPFQSHGTLQTHFPRHADGPLRTYASRITCISDGSLRTRIACASIQTI